MNGWAAFVVISALVGLTFYLHKRRLTWVAIALALISGILIAASPLGGWMRYLAGLIPYLALFILIVGTAVIGLDIRDKRPDKPSVIFSMIVPTFFALGLSQMPGMFDAIGTGFQKVGTEASTNNPLPNTTATPAANPSGR